MMVFCQKIKKKFKLEDNCFIMLCWFLPYDNMANEGFKGMFKEWNYEDLCFYILFFPAEKN